MLISFLRSVGPKVGPKVGPTRVLEASSILVADFPTIVFPLNCSL